MQKEKIIELKELIITQANNVEKMISHCMEGFFSKNKKILLNVIENEEIKVNSFEIDIEELYTSILALYQTEAKELRTVLMTAKMNNDLERIADQCVNIAESALFLIDKPELNTAIDFIKMYEIIKKMIADSITSFINEDIDTAKSVCIRDQEVDELNEKNIRDLISYMSHDSRSIERAYHLIRVSHNLEKIADLATNIAEETVYMAEGRDIKHCKDIKNK
ncbi:MAG: phosphate signaling complex protein PhoU [Spirochaetes bacterium]|nr:phosphate signaling complex protein PhoU [Spirochaetota bacterium]